MNKKIDTEENKYFTPNVEDIHVGYELEILEGFNWNKYIVPSTSAMYNKKKDEITPMFAEYTKIIHYLLYERDLIRVPYLTKAQIEKEGWKEIHDEEYIKDDKKEGRWWFNNNAVTEWQSTFEFRYGGCNHVKFQGECKDINTFIFVCKLLNI